MENFVYSVPTKVYFGSGQIERIGEIARAYGSRVLLVYGGGSIKKTGLYDRVMDLLKQAGVTVYELGGVEPNPRVTTVRKGVALCREHDIDEVLPVGGGSTIDCSKLIAGSVFYDGDPWDLMVDNSRIQKVLPIVTVLTLSATGSEMNSGLVITNPDTQEKFGMLHPALRPAASILDPTLTYTVSAYQTAAGTVDIMSHTLEGYFTNKPGGYLQCRMAEGLLRTCIHYGPIALAKPDDYEARANLMWAGSWALEGVLRLGQAVPSTVHPIEHQLSAYYDVTHAAGLAVLTPAWMDYVLSDRTVDKFKEYAVNVWGVDPALERYQAAQEGIARTRRFFIDLKMPTTLRELGIGTEKFAVMAENVAPSLQTAYVPFSAADVVKLFESVQ